MQVLGEGAGARMLLAVAAGGRAMKGGTAAECAALAAAAAPDPVLGSDGKRLLTPTPLLSKLVAAAVLVMADSERATRIFEQLMSDAQWTGAPHALMGANI